MPEINVRRRIRRRAAPLRERFKRWRYQHRPQIVVACVFVAAALLGAICVGLGVHALGGRGDAGGSAQAQ